MNAPATLPTQPSTDATLTLSFYAPDSEMAQRLAARLCEVARVQWIDSHQVSPTMLAESGQAGPLLLLDYSTAKAELSSQLARELAERLPECARVAVGSTHGDQAAGVLAALRAGVNEFIDVDADVASIRALLLRVLSEARQPRPAPTLAIAGATRQARLVLLKGVRPGVGTSTLAVHLAALAQQRLATAAAARPRQDGPADHVLLLDLGRPAGDVSLYLGVESGYSYEDLLRNTDRIDATFIRTAVARDRRGLAVVGEASQTLQAPSAGNNAATLVKRLRGLFDLVICDLGGLPDAQVPEPMLNAADDIWLVSDQSIGALVSLDAALQELDRRQARDARLGLVVDRHDEDTGIAASQIAARFELPLLASLPERSRALRGSASAGQLLCDQAPHDPYLRALAPLLDRLGLPAQPSHRNRSVSWQAIVRRLGIRK